MLYDLRGKRIGSVDVAIDRIRGVCGVYVAARSIVSGLAGTRSLRVVVK
jgi:hypothetical protein